MKPWLSLLCVVLFASACGGEEPPANAGWTVLVYQLMDNDLEPFGLQDLWEMAEVPPSSDLDIVVQADRSGGYTAEGVRNLDDWVGAKRIVVADGELTSVADLGQLDMASPDALADFVTWGVTSYPARHYALVLWDHGGAWPGFGIDESQARDTMSLSELDDALARGLEPTGVESFDIVGFDACLMATLEVALTVRSHAHYLVASEDLEPGHGWDYRALGAVGENPDIDAADLGARIVDGYTAQAGAADTARTITLSLVDLGRLAPLEAAVAALASRLGQDAPVAAPMLGQRQESAMRFGDAPDPARATHMVDLGDYAAVLGAGSPEYAALGEGVRAALDQAVVHSVAGEARARANGLSIYFPSRAEYYDPAYASVAAVGPWRDFLGSYYALGSSGTFAAPSFIAANHVADYQALPDGLVVSGTLAPEGAGHVSSALLTYALVDEAAGLTFVLGSRPAAVQGAHVEGYWNLGVLRITQGANIAYAYLGSEDSGAFENALIPFGYRAFPGADERYVILVLVLDAQGNIAQATYFVEQGGAFGELAPLPGSELWPLVPVIDSQGREDWADGADLPIDPSSQFFLDFEALAPGTRIYAELAVEDFSGRGDYVSIGGTL